MIGNRNLRGALYEQHPLPWIFSDHGGVVAVYDAAGKVVIATGDMEDCTGADIDLAYLITAAPELLKAVGGFLWLGNNIDNITHDPARFRRYYEAALEDARAAYEQARYRP